MYYKDCLNDGVGPLKASLYTEGSQITSYVFTLSLQMATLVPVENIVSSAHSKKLARKIVQAEKLLCDEAAKYGMKDSGVATPKSSDLVVNLLINFSGLNEDDEGKANLKTRDTVNNMITTLRWVHRNHEHIGSWTVRIENN